MLRKTMIALFAMASVAVLAPDAASARGGFGGGGFMAVVAASTAVAFGGGGFRGGGFGGGGFRTAASAAAASVRPRSAAVVSCSGNRRLARWRMAWRMALGFITGDFRLPPPASAWASATASTAMATDGYYGAYPAAYDDSYYYGDGGYGGCYVARQRVLTRYGWRIRRCRCVE